jgi:hypothetical protein
MKHKYRFWLILTLVLALSSSLVGTFPLKAASPHDLTNSTFGVTAGSNPLPADNFTTVTLTFVAKDSDNALVSGANVSIAKPTTNAVVTASSAGATIGSTSITGLSDAAGTFFVTFRFPASDAGTSGVAPLVTGFASSGAATKTLQATVTIKVPPPDTAVANPTSINNIPADATTQATFTVTVKDKGGDLLNGYTVTPSATPNTGLSGLGAQTTGSSGVVTFSVTSNTIQTTQISLLVTNANTSSLTANNAVSITFVKPNPDSTKSYVTASPLSQYADGVSTVTVTMTLLDKGGNPIAGDSGSLTPLQHGSSSAATGLTITGPSQAGGVSDTFGNLTFTVTTTTVQVVDFSGTSNSVTIPYNQAGHTPATVNFGAAPPSAANSTVAAAPGTAPADGSTTVTVTVTAKDSGNNLLSGRAVVLSANPSTGISGVGSQTTNSSGVATFTIKSTNATTVTFSATIDGIAITQTAQVVFTVPGASVGNSTLLYDTQTAPADNQSNITFTLTLKDAGGNPLPNKSVTPTFNPSAGITMTPVTTGGKTDSNGQFVFKLKSSTAYPSPSGVSVQVFDSTDNVTVPAVGVQVFYTLAFVNASLSTLTTSKTNVVADNTDSATLTVTLKDSGGQAAANRTVTIQTLNGTFPGVTITPTTTTTNSSGVATFVVKSNTTYQTPPGVQFGAIVTQPDNSTTQITQTVNVLFTSAPAVACNVQTPTITGILANSGASAAGQATVIVSFTTAAGVAVDSKTVQLIYPNSTQGVFLPNPTVATGSTGTPGQAQWNPVGSDREQTIQFQAKDITDNFLCPTPISISFVDSTGPADGTKSTITVSPTSVNADGTSFALIQVILKDSTGTPVKNATVTVSASGTIAQGGTGYNITAPSGNTTDLSGTVLFHITSGTAGTLNISAIGAGAGLSFPTPITFNSVANPVDANKSTISASPTIQTIPGNITITVTLLNSSSNPVSGQPVNLTVPAGVTVTTPQPQTSNASGVATFTITSSTPGSYTIGAVAGTTPSTVTLANTVQVTFNPAGCATTGSTVTISPGSSQPANGSAQFTVTVTLLNGAVPYANTPVVLNTSPSGSDTITPNTATNTNASGVATFTISSTTAGTRTAVATAQIAAQNCILSAQPTFTFFNTSSGIDPNKSYISVTGSPAPANNSTLITVSVNLFDSSGFQITTQPSVTLSLSPNTPTITTNPVVANASGVATFTVKSTAPGTYNITATVGSVTINHIQNSTTQATLVFSSLPGQIDPTQSSVVVSGSPTTPGGTVTVTVTVKDSTGTGLQGKQVNLTVPAASGTLTVGPSNPQTTPTNGVVTYQLVSSVAFSSAVTVVLDPSGQNISLTASSQAVWQNAVASSARSTINVSPTSVVANGTSTATVTVLLLDSSGNAVGGKSVTLNPVASVSTGNLVGTMTTTSNSSGIAAFAIASTVAQTVSFTATDTTDSVSITTVASGGSNTVVYTSGTGISPTLSTVTASPTSVPADGVSTTTISVNVKTVGGANVAGATVNLFANPTTGLVSSTNPTTTDANGNATFTVRSSTPETVVFTVQVSSTQGSATLAQTPSVTFTSAGSGTVSCANSSWTINYTSIPADGTTTATFTATQRNSSNQGVSGVTVTLTTSSSGVSISPATATTDTNGNASFSIKSSGVNSVSGSVTLSFSETTNTPCYATTTLTFTASGTSPSGSGTGNGSGTNSTGSGSGNGTNLLNPPSTGPSTGKVIAYRLRVRTGPGLNYHILGLLKEGTIVVLTARNARGSWYQIQIANGTAWSSAYYIRVKRLAYRHLPVITDYPPAPNDNNTPAKISTQ